MNDLNPEIWADMTSDERSTYYIAEEYEKYAKDRHDMHTYCPSARTKSITGEYPADKIRNHKNWKYFKQVWDFYKEDSKFDPYLFMQSIIHNNPKNKFLFPAQLANKENLLEYPKYLYLMSHKEDNTKTILENITQTYKFIAKKMEVQELKTIDLYKFFNTPNGNGIYSLGLLCCMHNMVTRYYYPISKTFIMAYRRTDKDIRDEIISVKEISEMEVTIKSNDKVYQFLKKLFKDDIL
jgi:hypothetical protein